MTEYNHFLFIKYVLVIFKIFYHILNSIERSRIRYIYNEYYIVIIIF